MTREGAGGSVGSALARRVACTQTLASAGRRPLQAASRRPMTALWLADWLCAAALRLPNSLGFPESFVKALFGIELDVSVVGG